MKFTATNGTDMSGNPYFKVVMESAGKTTIRNLSVSQFIEVLGKSTTEERQYIQLRDGFFPETAVSTWFSDYENYSCVWEVPAKVRLLILRTALGDKHFHVPFPKMLFAIQVKNGQVTKKACFAMKKGTDKIFHYPFGNVASTGDICMGNISTSDMQKVSDFSDAFFSGITGNDYFGSSGAGKVSVSFSQEQLLEKISTLKAFPDAFLVEDKAHTLKGLCEKFPLNYK